MTIQKPWIMRATLLLLAALSIVSVAGETTPVHAEAERAPPTVMVILDGSGSMWGKLGEEDKTKLGLSQSLLIEALSTPNPKLNLGFASFGHRKAGNCSDAQVIVPPGPLNTETVTQKIAKLNPRGKGPLSLALRKTAASIDPDVSSSVVLIHDGYDNCRQDPCQVVQEIATSHPNLAIQLISLDLPKDAAVAMSCLATKTNGTAYNARNEFEFKAAVQSAMALTMLQPPKAADRLTDKALPDVESQSAADKGPSRLRLVAGFKTDASQHIRNVTWRIVSPAAPQNALIEKRATELTERITPGRYIVHAKVGLAEVEQQITVSEHGETRARLKLEAGVIAFANPTSQNIQKNIADPMFLSLKHTTNDASSDIAGPLWIGAAKNTDQLIVPSGAYELEIERGSITKTVSLTVKAGETTTMNTTLDGGVLVLDSSTTIAQGTEVAATDGLVPRLIKNVAYIISTDDPSAPNGRREVGRSASRIAKFQLPPGTFYAEAQMGQTKRERRFAIGDGQVVRHQFRFDVAQVTLEARFGTGPPPDTTQITFKAYALSAGTGRGPVFSTNKRNPKLLLPTGRYRFEAEVAGKVRGKSIDVDVRSGANQTYTIPLNAGLVNLQPHSTSGGKLAVPTRYQIRDASGVIVWRGRAERQMSTLLAPGTYALEKRSNPDQKQNFDVQVGGVTVVKLNATQ